MSNPGMLAAPAGLPDSNEIAAELTPLDSEVVLGKPKPSALRLQTYLTYLGIDTLVVIGMVTRGCVRATVIDAYHRNYRIVLPHECVAEYSWFQHKASSFDVHLKHADCVTRRRSRSTSATRPQADTFGRLVVSDFPSGRTEDWCVLPVDRCGRGAE